MDKLIPGPFSEDKSYMFVNFLVTSFMRFSSTNTVVPSAFVFFCRLLMAIYFWKPFLQFTNMHRTFLLPLLSLCADPPIFTSTS